MQHIIQKRPDIKFFDYILCEFDHIAYDFLYMIWPMPEMFELKEILAIPINKDKIEQRHELMLSIILERIRNNDKYESSRPAKQSKDNELIRRKKDSIYFREKDPKTGLGTISNLPVRSDSSVLRIEGCSKHTAEVKEIKDALYSAEKEKRDMQQIKTHGRVWGNWNVYIRPYEHMEFTDRRREGEHYKYVYWDVDYKLLNQRIKAVLSLAKEAGYNNNNNNNDIETFLREKIPPTDPLDLQSCEHAAGKLNRYLISEEVTNEMT